MGFLDESGLSRFLDKFKAWMNASGNAATATKLATARSLKTDLASTASVTFDGSAAQDSIPVTGVLPIANGGTGASAKSFVDLSSSQTVGGVKTFSNAPIFPSLVTILLKTDKYEIPSSASFASLQFEWNNDGARNGRLSGLEQGVRQNGTVDFDIFLFPNQSENPYGWLRVVLGIGTSPSYTRSLYSYKATANGVTVNTNLGSATDRWGQIYTTTSVDVSSDERLKDAVEPFPDEVLDAWGEVGFVQYQLKNSIAEKGSAKARLHSGLIAQRVNDAFKRHGLDAGRYGLFCHDEWDAQEEERGEDGTVRQEARPAGDEYSIRYEEALCMEAAFQRRRADRAEARLASLEARLAALEERMDG